MFLTDIGYRAYQRAALKRPMWRRGGLVAKITKPIAASIMLLLLLVMGANGAEERAVKFGLTAVVVRENLRFFDAMSDYLSRSVGRPVVFVRRKSYHEIMELLESGELDFAWICGYPFVQNRSPEYLSLLAVPIYKGRPHYRSIVIVHRDSQYKSLNGLRKKVFAYSDPNSNSGFLYPRYFLARKGEDIDTYFRQTFFTYNHAETVEAVAARVADGGAVESYVWEFLKSTNPEMVEKTRVIHKSPPFGFPPIVAHLNAPDELVRKMAKALTQMNEAPDGRQLLKTLNLDGFGRFGPEIFDDIKIMVQKMKAVQKANARAPVVERK